MTDSLHERLFAFRENLVVAASAGTGKTHTLVGVIVHMVLGASELGGTGGLHEPVDPARIVATTFSRKAAAEIRERLATSLERFAMNDDGAKYRSDVEQAFARHGVKVSRSELARRARRGLDRMGVAKIGTLHGFATTLVKSHALEIGIAPGFELLSEDDASAQAEAAIEEALSRFADEEPEGARALVRASGGVDRLVQDVARILDRLSEDGSSAEDLAGPSDDAREIERTLDDLVTSVLPIQAHPKHGATASELVSAWKTRDLARLEDSLSRTLAIRKDDRQPTLADFVDAREKLDGPTHPERARRLHRLYRDRESLAPVVRFARELVIRAQRDLERARRKSSSLAFGDVLRVARDLLRQRPDVAAEMGESLDALLVDEFQDTSRVQCDLVRLLWEKEPKKRAPGTVPHAAELRRHGLLVVGDRKQSIYGFRGADVAVFAEFCVGLAGWRARENLRITSDDVELPETPVAKFVALRENWRSLPPVLTFANAFSQHHMAGGGTSLYEVTYAPEVEDLIPPAEKPVAPEFSEGLSRRVTWLRPAGEGSSKRIDEAHAIAERIRTMAATGRGAGDKPRPYRDFAVLALTNQMLDTMAFALARVDVPYVVAGRGFFSAREVRDVVAMLAALVRPHDRLAWATVLRSPWVGLGDRALLGLTAPRRGLIAPPPADLRTLPRGDLLQPIERERLLYVFEIMGRLRRNVDRIAPATLLREAARSLHFEEALVQLPRGAQRASNVQKVFALAERTPSARALLRKLERAIEREAQETDAATFSDEDDAVRLLTVHASKGLSFPIVFVPQVGADRSPRRSSGIFLEPATSREPPHLCVRHVDRHGAKVDPPSVRRAKEAAKARELAERRRLTYVALTRAEEAMVLVGRRKPTASAGYRASPAFTLNELSISPESMAKSALMMEDAGPADEAVASAAKAPDAPRPRRVRLPQVPHERVQSVAVTPLVDFQHCARRFQLAHLLEVPEELPPALRVTEVPSSGESNAALLSPREEGTLLHAILEHVDAAAFGSADPAAPLDEAAARVDVLDAEAKRRVLARATRFLKSDYAGRIAREGAKLHREVPFVLALSGPRATTSAPPPMATSGRAEASPERGERDVETGEEGLPIPGVVGLRGTVDLAVQWPDGSVDVLDYKRARGPSPEPYALQLDVYSLAMRQALSASTVRTGIVFLGANGATEPVFRRTQADQTTAPALEASLATLVARLVRARWTRAFPRVEISTCQRIRCGYVHLCHPKTPITQLGLFGR